MRKLLSLSAVLLLCFLTLAPSVFALDIPEHTSELFVNDFASVISEADKSIIKQQGEELYYETDAQIAVATVESLDGSDIETYANEMFRKWKLGDKEKNNGVLLLLSVGDRKVRIEVGYGLEGALNDSKCGRILRGYGNPYFSDDNFSEGLRSVYDVLIDEVCDEYGIDHIAGVSDNGGDDDDDYLRSYDDDESYDFDEVDLELLIAAIVILFTIISSISRRIRRVRRGGSFFDVFDDDDRHGGYHGGYHGGGFSGGGFSGGGFSGGGGSSGGGGASSSF